MTDKAVGVCLCVDPETHPNGDTITFREQVGMKEMGIVRLRIAFMYLAEPESGFEELLPTIRETYLFNFIDAWTLKGPDDKGKLKALPITKANVRERILLGNPIVAEELGDFADELYADRITRPLVQRVLNSSGLSLTDDSTSAEETSPPKMPKNESRQRSSKRSSGRKKTPSPQSLTTTTPMAATTQTS